MRVVFVTCSPDEADSLLRTLLEERLVACGNIFSGVRSLYIWQGEICDDAETVILMETLEERVEAAMERIRELHSYDTPKIVTFAVPERDAGYYGWLREVVAPGA